MLVDYPRFPLFNKRRWRSLNILLFVILSVSSTGCKEKILHDLDELHANRVCLALAQAQIQADKVREGSLWSIAVSTSKTTEALSALKDSRVLRVRAESPSGLSRGIIQTREERAHLLERNLAWSLEQTLERLPHVLEARVHLHFAPENRYQLAAKKKQRSASVVLVVSLPKAIDAQHVQQLVSGAAGVQTASVSVILVPGRASPPMDIVRRIPAEQEEIGKGIQGAPARMKPAVQAQKRKPLALLPLFSIALPDLDKRLFFIALLVFLSFITAVRCRVRKKEKALRKQTRQKIANDAAVLTPRNEDLQSFEEDGYSEKQSKYQHMHNEKRDSFH